MHPGSGRSYWTMTLQVKARRAAAIPASHHLCGMRVGKSGMSNALVWCRLGAGLPINMSVARNTAWLATEVGT